MLKTKVGFIVYGVHKDGLKDPISRTYRWWIDKHFKGSPEREGSGVDEHDIVVASKKQFRHYQSIKNDTIDAIVLFSEHGYGQHICLLQLEIFPLPKRTLYDAPRFAGLRPVGGLVLTAALKEIGIKHRFVYGDRRMTRTWIRRHLLPGKRSCQNAEPENGMFIWWRGMGQNQVLLIPTMDKDLRYRYRFQRYHTAHRKSEKLKRRGSGRIQTIIDCLFSWASGRHRRNQQISQIISGHEAIEGRMGLDY